MRAYIFVLCWFCVHLVNAGTYRAGVIDSSNKLSNIVQLVYEAGKKNVDVLVLPSDVSGSEDDYDKNVKDLSKAARQSGLYLIANLNEKTRCQNKHETVRSNLVFDRQGSIISVYRKPLSITANCTTPTPGLATFVTDFGVTFGVMMEEDLVLKSFEELQGLKNVIVTGSWSSEIPLLSASQFAATWAYTANMNLLSNHGIFAGTAGIQTASGRLVIAELQSNCDQEKAFNPPAVIPANIHDFPGEDLNQYIIRPLNVEASTKGYKESVCHNNFCCEFDVKTNFQGSKQDDVSYGLAAFDGVRHYGGGHHIGAQNCAVLACAGLYKRTCGFGSPNNNTNIAFERLTISANFTSTNSIQYPVILSNNLLPNDRFSFVTKTVKNTKQVTVCATDIDNLLTFGIFGRDFQNDYEMPVLGNKDGGIYDYIFNEDVQEFFDYIWIRLRILIFIVSIYVLEMM